MPIRCTVTRVYSSSTYNFTNHSVEDRKILNYTSTVYTRLNFTFANQSIRMFGRLFSMEL